MTLEKLLQDYSQLPNTDRVYNSSILNREDLCASNSKYLYGYHLNFLIRCMIKNEKDICPLKNFVVTHCNDFRWEYKIVTLIFAQYLTLNPSDINAYNDFSKYLLKYSRNPENADQITDLVDKKQFEQALEIIKSMLR